MLCLSAALFFYQTFDAMDGKQVLSLRFQSFNFQSLPIWFLELWNRHFLQKRSPKRPLKSRFLFVNRCFIFVLACFGWWIGEIQDCCAWTWFFGNIKTGFIPNNLGVNIMVSPFNVPFNLWIYGCKFVHLWSQVKIDHNFRRFCTFKRFLKHELSHFRRVELSNIPLQPKIIWRDFPL